jgi:transcriptional regulator with XRE-family HTH domain
MATTLKTRSKSLQIGETQSSLRTRRGQLLSKSMERTFHRYLNKPGARHAFIEAEAATFLASQIRVLRIQRGWLQKDLAKRLGTTQAVVSRLEDPSYGRITFKTMMELAKVFDVAPMLKFVSTIDFMRERWIIQREAMEVESFEAQAPYVAFVSSTNVSLLANSTERSTGIHLLASRTPSSFMLGGFPASANVTSYVSDAVVNR